VAKPRVFISSTYFDLRVVRADLERFITQMGYEPVLFERGHVPYRKENPLEEDCYREVQGCDILIAIIGGKYGSQSKDMKHSITQRELKTASHLIFWMTAPNQTRSIWTHGSRLFAQL
jgi:hypothetical protein